MYFEFHITEQSYEHRVSIDFFFPNSVYCGYPINVMCVAVLSLVVLTSLFVRSGSLQLYIA